MIRLWLSNQTLKSKETLPGILFDDCSCTVAATSNSCGCVFNSHRNLVCSNAISFAQEEAKEGGGERKERGQESHVVEIETARIPTEWQSGAWWLRFAIWQFGPRT